MTAGTAESPVETALPLAGLRVVEAGSLVAGPFCCQLLGDFGAEIVKVEQPRGGDPIREWGQARRDGHALWWPILGRNKKSVELDLRKPAGQDAFRRLCAQADVLVENFRPGTLEGWNLGFDALSALNPGLVMVRVSGYGQTGPYAAKAGYASVGEAMGGLRNLVGYPDRPSCRVGLALGDTVAGLFAGLGALVALQERHRTGLGQIVDTAIYESVLACMESTLPEYALGGHVRERVGSTLPGVAPSNAYPTSDGELIIAANQDTVFRRLCDAMGRPDLAAEPRFSDHLSRGTNQQALDEIVANWSRDFSSAELLSLLEAHGVPAGRIYRAPDMFDDPHFAARQSIITRQHPELGGFPMQNVTPRLGRTPGGVRSLGPALGAHSIEVLGDLLGLDAAQIAAAQGRAGGR